jgi:RNA recognition motif-containing protein
VSFDSIEGQLKNLFEPCGMVELSKFIVDQFTNRSRGFRFIKMQNREEGLLTIQELDSKDLGGKCRPQILVNNRAGIRNHDFRPLDSLY